MVAAGSPKETPVKYPFMPTYGSIRCLLAQLRVTSTKASCVVEQNLFSSVH